MRFEGTINKLGNLLWGGWELNEGDNRVGLYAFSKIALVKLLLLSSAQNFIIYIPIWKKTFFLSERIYLQNGSVEILLQSAYGLVFKTKQLDCHECRHANYCYILLYYNFSEIIFIRSDIKTSPSPNPVANSPANRGDYWQDLLLLKPVFTSGQL